MAAPPSAPGADDVRAYWEQHYEQVFAAGNSWLDYSNERVHLQTLGLCLELADALHGRRCLDLGCGRGQLAQVLASCGAHVTGLDASVAGIAELRGARPDLTWRVANLLDDGYLDGDAPFDRAFMIEVLQYLPLAATLRRVWGKLAPGGRMIAMVPNAACPIVQRTVARFDGRFVAPSGPELAAVLGGLPDVEAWAMRALAFRADQRITPYEVRPWSTEPPDGTPPPNRIQFVAIKRG
jgi:2-polyprenyl-3-methyl-5-hydroxy-6-metoxy-1,4-benzoquinol methylase